MDDTFNIQLAARISKRELQDFKVYSAKIGRPMNDLLGEAIRGYLRKYRQDLVKEQTAQVAE